MEQHSKTVDAKTAAPILQGSKLDEDGTSIIKTLREAWGIQTGPAENENPALRVKEMLETTHDQAARDVYAETQKAMGRRTIILEPHALEQCLANVRQGNR